MANTLGDGSATETGAAEGSTAAEPDDGGGVSGVATGPGGETGPVDPTGADTTSGPVSGDGVLEISDGPVFDFSEVGLGGFAVHPFTVRNIGDGLANAIAAQDLGDAFEFEGGAYPGSGGDCGSSLAALDSCTLVVSFVPPRPGLHAQELVLGYGGGLQAARSMVGGGVGSSDNLLANPDGESGAAGTPPPAWIDDGPGTWETGYWINGQGGSGQFIAGSLGPNNTEYRLIQTVSAAPWATTIDAGAMRFDFSGWVRALEPGNDDHRVRVRYLDAKGAVLDTWSSGWETVGNWSSRSDARLAPPSTRSIEVQLGCRKSGGEYCDAYYDSLDLRAVYP
ncbi:MAG: hypothetical protein AB1Z98_21235 [Nannocystaceae bacterium]